MLWLCSACAEPTKDEGAGSDGTSELDAVDSAEPPEDGEQANAGAVSGVSDTDSGSGNGSGSMLDENSPPLDASSADFPLEVGVTSGPGTFDFRDVADGDTVDLVLGFQGLQHVEVIVRHKNIGLGPHRTEVRLTRVTDGKSVAVPYSFEVGYDDGGDWVYSPVIFAVVPQPDDVIGAGEMLLQVVVETATGASAATSRAVFVKWYGS
jgi:hypothetical protein